VGSGAGKRLRIKTGRHPWGRRRALGDERKRWGASEGMVKRMGDSAGCILCGGSREAKICSAKSVDRLGGQAASDGKLGTHMPWGGGHWCPVENAEGLLRGGGSD